MSQTTRWGIHYPELSDGPEGADVPYWMRLLALDLDDVAKDDQGTLAGRPVSTPASPGKKGRYYMVKGDSTTANNGVLWRDNGTGWDAIGTVQPNSVATIDIQDNAVTLAKMADASVGTAELIDAAAATGKIADAAVTSAKIAAALKPSQGAGGATEALRALGTDAGTAAPGQHAAQHRRGGADFIGRVLETLGWASAHLEAGTATLTDTGSGATATYTFATAFTSAPYVILGPKQAGTWLVAAVSISQVTITLSAGAGARNCDWVAIGPG